MKILAIDDNQDNLTVLGAILKDAMPSSTLLTATSGALGLELAQAQDPDVILLDIVMPGMDGFAVCRKLKEDERLRLIPVVFLTALRTDAYSHVKALEVGAEAFLTKPLAEAELVTQVRTMARIKEANVARLTEQDRLAALVEERTRELKRELDERKRVELALREQEERFRAIVEGIPDALFIKDLQGRYLLVNGATASFAGKSPEDIIGHDDSALFPPKEARALMGNDRRAMDGGRIVSFEENVTTADGVARTFYSTKGPLRDVTGNAIGLFGIARDISGLKATEERLRHSEERFRTIFEQAPLGVSIIESLTGRFVQVNDKCAAILGRSREELQSLDWMSITHPDDLPAGLERMARLNAGEIEGYQKEKRYLRPDGSAVHVSLTIRQLSAPVSGDQAPCHIAIIEDISEREELQAQLQQSQKMEAVGQLAGGIAHDFNNMLSIILGYGEAMLQELNYSDPLRHEVLEIVDAAQRSAALTRQLLAFSRRQELKLEVLDINVLVNGLMPLLHRMIGENIDLAIALGKKVSMVKADPAQIEQVIMNLAINARDAMPDGGRLTMESADVELDQAYCDQHPGMTPGRFVMLAVSDNGSGMDRQTLTHIFEPFFTTKGKGTGLGLSTVYGIVKQLDGYVLADSEPGKGTTFRIYLPQERAAPQRAPAARPPGNTDRGHWERVLVVEDEASIRKLIEAILGRLDLHVTSASSAEDALQLVGKGFKPDLVITDVIMPGMSGTALVNRLHEKLPEFKALYMSGYTDSAVPQGNLLDQGVLFIQKPFSTRDFTDKVLELLHRDQSGQAA